MAGPSMYTLSMSNEYGPSKYTLSMSNECGPTMYTLSMERVQLEEIKV